MVRSSLLAVCIFYFPCSGLLRMLSLRSPSPQPYSQVRAGGGAEAGAGWGTVAHICLVALSTGLDAQDLKTNNRKLTCQDRVLRLAIRKSSHREALSPPGVSWEPYLIFFTEENESQNCRLHREVPETICTP